MSFELINCDDDNLQGPLVHPLTRLNLSDGQKGRTINFSHAPPYAIPAPSTRLCKGGKKRGRTLLHAKSKQSSSRNEDPAASWGWR